MNELHSDLARILFPNEAIQRRVKEMADQISRDFGGVDRLYIVGILKGAFIFLADLTRQLNIPHVVDFMALSSYGKSTESGAVRILMDLREPIEGQHVLIVEDIIDTGISMNYIRERILNREPRSLKICTLLNKKERREVDLQLDYVGFEIPNEFVVGYGLDYDNKYRNLPYISIFKKTA